MMRERCLLLSICGLLSAVSLACGGNTTSQPTSTTTTTVLVDTARTGQGCAAVSTEVLMPALSVTRLLAFGDSMTGGTLSTALRGLLAAPQKGYPSRLQAFLSANYPCQTVVVVNEGLDGEWAQDGEHRLARLLAVGAFDVVLLMEGANDLNAVGASGMTATLRSIDGMIQEAARANARVLLATLPPQRPDGSRAGNLALVVAFNDRIKALAAARGVVIVDVFSAFGGDLTLLGSDGLHPTEAGYDRIAGVFFDVIRTNFEIRAAVSAR